MYCIIDLGVLDLKTKIKDVVTNGGCGTHSRHGGQSGPGGESSFMSRSGTGLEVHFF